MSTIYSENAARFATTRESVDEQLAVRRGEGIRQAVELLASDQAGRRQRALWVVMRSFLDQLAIAGLSSAGIPGMADSEPAGLVRRRTGGRHAAVVVASCAVSA